MRIWFMIQLISSYRLNFDLFWAQRCQTPLRPKWLVSMLESPVGAKVPDPFAPGDSKMVCVNRATVR